MSPRSPKLPIGWREWIALPDLGIARIKAKADTGARSSSIHAFDVKHFRRRGRDWVRFKVHPEQRDTKTTLVAEAELLEMRKVKSSTGHVTLRPVIRTMLDVLGKQHPIDLTLASRDAMGFRMLLGREALRGHYLVDPGRSWYGGRPKRKKTRRGAPRSETP